MNKKAQRKAPVVIADGKPFKGIKCSGKDSVKPFAFIKINATAQVLLLCTEEYLGGIIVKESMGSRDIPVAQIEIDGRSHLVTTGKASRRKDKSVFFEVATIVQNVEELDEEALGPPGPPEVSCDHDIKEFTWNEKNKMLQSEPSKKKITDFFSGFTGMHPTCQKKWKKKK